MDPNSIKTIPELVSLLSLEKSRDCFMLLLLLMMVNRYKLIKWFFTQEVMSSVILYHKVIIVIMPIMFISLKGISRAEMLLNYLYWRKMNGIGYVKFVIKHPIKKARFKTMLKYARECMTWLMYLQHYTFNKKFLSRTHIHPLHLYFIH